MFSVSAMFAFAYDDLPAVVGRQQQGWWQQRRFLIMTVAVAMAVVVVHVHLCILAQAVLMYLTKGPQNLVMQLCHRVPDVVWQTAAGARPYRQGGAAGSTDV